MIPRKIPRRQLDAAVERSGVTILKGLPRVGRSSFLEGWEKQRTDTVLCQQVDDIRFEPSIFVMDHVENHVVEEIIRRVREIERAKSRTRLVLAANDLVTTDRLLSARPGDTEVVEITPLQLEELGVGMGQSQMTAGPKQVAPLAASPAPVPAADTALHWLRGGLPDSLFAEDDRESLLWRRRMLEVLLARDYTKWGIERAFSLVDLFNWISDQNSSEVDENSCSFAKRQELKSGVHVLEQLGLVRRLRNYVSGRNSSAERKQRILVRDTGLLHAALGIDAMNQLRASQAIGGSFESYATEALILATEGLGEAFFYREKGENGEDEIDLILKFPFQGNRLVAIEFKVSPNQKAKRGFYKGCEALGIDDCFVVHSGEIPDRSETVHRLDVRSATTQIAQLSRSN